MEIEVINQKTKKCFLNAFFINYNHFMFKQNIFLVDRQLSNKNCEFNGHIQILVLQLTLLFLITSTQSSIILQSQIMTNLIVL